MFNKFDSRRIEFVSNPPLPDEGRIVPYEKNGVICNKLQYFPSSNRSYFDGIEFNKDSMSLRAKLNLGVPLSLVGFGQIENDPLKLQNVALHLENQILDRIHNLEVNSNVNSSVPVNSIVSSSVPVNSIVESSTSVE